MEASCDSSTRWPLIPISNAPVYFDPTARLGDWFSVEMALTHNLMIRSINALWRNAPLITPADETAFAGYVLSGVQFIHSHHDGEEHIVFPRLQAKLDMQHNVDQHEAFQEQMLKLEEYFKKVQTKKEKYDAETTRRLLEALGDPLVVHLTEEIDTITPEKMSAFTHEELQAMNKAMEDHLKSSGGFFTQIPFGLTAHDKTQAPEWPPLPSALKWFVTRIAYFMNRSFWKFAPFTRYGEPQVYSG